MTYPSIEDFYAARGGDVSGEADFGVMWTEAGKRWPTFRVSVVHTTGDVYAVNHATGEIELLGTVDHACNEMGTAHLTICAYSAAEHLLKGWAEERHDLEWIRERIGAVPA